MPETPKMKRTLICAPFPWGRTTRNCDGSSLYRHVTPNQTCSARSLSRDPQARPATSRKRLRVRPWLRTTVRQPIGEENLVLERSPSDQCGRLPDADLLRENK